MLVFKPKYVIHKFEKRESYWGIIKPIQKSISEHKEQS